MATSTFDSVTRLSGAAALVLASVALYRTVPASTTPTHPRVEPARASSTSRTTTPAATIPTTPIAEPRLTTPAPQPAVSVATSRPSVREPSQRAAQQQPRAGIAVRRLLMAHDIQAHEPVDASTTLTMARDQRLVGFVELSNRSGEDRSVVLSFEREGGNGSVGNVVLNVPAGYGRYRTWGFTRMVRTPGSWTAIVRTPDGDELARHAFRVNSAE